MLGLISYTRKFLSDNRNIGNVFVKIYYLGRSNRIKSMAVIRHHKHDSILEISFSIQWFKKILKIFISRSYACRVIMSQFSQKWKCKIRFFRIFVRFNESSEIITLKKNASCKLLCWSIFHKVLNNIKIITFIFSS